jgi:hypothetical protein
MTVLHRRATLGQAEMVWMLTAFLVAVVMGFALLSFQRLYAVQNNGRAVLAAAAKAAAIFGSCAQAGGADQQRLDPTASEVAFIEEFYQVTHLTPTGVESPTQSPIGQVDAAGLQLIQPTCSLAVNTGSSVGGGTPAEYVLTYPAANPYLQPFTVTLAIYEPPQVGQPLPGDPSLQAQQRGVFALMQGETMYTLANLSIESVQLRAAVFDRVTGTPPPLEHPQGP